jgi:hypothetical protein
MDGIEDLSIIKSRQPKTMTITALAHGMKDEVLICDEENSI